MIQIQAKKARAVFEGEVNLVIPLRQIIGVLMEFQGSKIGALQQGAAENRGHITAQSFTYALFRAADRGGFIAGHADTAVIALQDFGQQWPSNGKPHPAEGRAENTVRRTVDGFTNGHGSLREVGSEITQEVVTDQSRILVGDLDNMFRDLVVVATKLVRFE